MSVIPCESNDELRAMVDAYAEQLKIEAHRIGDHGLDSDEFYQSGIFRGAIEKIRGEFSATMREKREFVAHILNYLQDQGLIGEWESSGESNRHDYIITLNSGRIAAIELKGCLDGNNTNIYSRPPNAEEFVIWSVCTNPGADPRHNAWSGIHTRLSAEIISSDKPLDGLIVWDRLCGTIARPCPKLVVEPENATVVGPYRLPPPCIYLFPRTVPSPRNNPAPRPQQLHQVELLEAFHQCFGGRDRDLNYVEILAAHHGNDTVRTTRVVRNNEVQRESRPTSIRRA